MNNSFNHKVAICSIGKMENRYIREYVEYYKKIGVDKIFLFDNNLVDGERFEEVIDDYVSSNFVELINYRGKRVCQLDAYRECYERFGEYYDFICYFDCDEFLTFTDETMNIKSYLFDERFKDFDIIHVNWLCMTDSGLIEYEDRPLVERFTIPCSNDKVTNNNFPLNQHVKSIVRGSLRDRIIWDDSCTPHSPHCNDKNIKICNAVGVERVQNFPLTFEDTDISLAYLRHFTTKTIDEFVEIKVQRGYPDGNVDFFKTANMFEEFFRINDYDEEKLNFISNKYSK